MYTDIWIYQTDNGDIMIFRWTINPKILFILCDIYKILFICWKEEKANNKLADVSTTQYALNYIDYFQAWPAGNGVFLIW